MSSSMDAATIIQRFADSFGPDDVAYEPSLVRVRVAYSLFADECSVQENGDVQHTKEQNIQIDKITNAILDGRKTGEISLTEIAVVHGEQVLFVYRFRSASNKERFTDYTGRVYCSWDDWLQNNTLPAARIRFPVGGKYPAKGTAVQVASDTTPAGRLGNQVVAVVDDFVTGSRLVMGLTTIALIFFPQAAVAAALAPVLFGADVTLASYSFARAATTLADMGMHGQSVALTNGEAFYAWLSLAVAGLGGGTSVVSNYVNSLAKAGGAISKSFAAFANWLTCGKITATAASVATKTHGMCVDPKKRTPLGFVQLAMSAFFLTRSVAAYKSVISTKPVGPPAPKPVPQPKDDATMKPVPVPKTDIMKPAPQARAGPLKTSVPQTKGDAFKTGALPRADAVRLAPQATNDGAVPAPQGKATASTARQSKKAAVADPPMAAHPEACATVKRASKESSAPPADVEAKDPAVGKDSRKNHRHSRNRPKRKERRRRNAHDAPP